MTASYCLTEAQRISKLPASQWADQTKALPERCEHSDCTTGNCREVVQTWLRMQFRIDRALKNANEMDAKRRGGR